MSITILPITVLYCGWPWSVCGWRDRGRRKASCLAFSRCSWSRQVTVSWLKVPTEKRQWSQAGPQAGVKQGPCLPNGSWGNTEADAAPNSPLGQRDRWQKIFRGGYGRCLTIILKSPHPSLYNQHDGHVFQREQAAYESLFIRWFIPGVFVGHSHEPSIVWMKCRGWGVSSSVGLLSSLAMVLGKPQLTMQITPWLCSWDTLEMGRGVGLVRRYLRHLALRSSGMCSWWAVL